MRYFFLLLLYSLIYPLFGQNTLPPYRLYTLRDGLPQMQIWSMFQDRRGYLWVGTKGGLSRFDGRNFVNFTEKDGLPENQIEQIAEDYSGKIWIVTRRGLSVYNGQSIATFPRSVISLKIAPTPDGKIWYFGHDLKNLPLFGYLENGKYISVLNDYPGIQAPYYDICYSGSRKSLLISSGHQLFELANKQLKLLKTVSYALRIERDGEDIIFQQWDAQNHIKLYEFRSDSLMQVAEVVDGKIVGPNRARFVHRILWCGIFHQVIVVDKDHIETKDFPDQYLNVCLTDRDNHLWLGTEEGAVQCYAGGFETYSRETLPLIWTMVEDRQQNIWFSSYSSGLMKFDGQTITCYSAEYLKRFGASLYFQAQADENGVLYFPNNFGIIYFDGQSFGSIKNNLCWASYYDKERKILFGGYNKRVEAYDLKHRLVRSIGEQDGLPNISAIAAFGKDRRGFIWMGAYRGLLRYNWETREIKQYLKSTDNQKVNGATSVYSTPNGITWFGGTQGLLWYDEKADSVRKIESDEITEIVNLVSSIDSTWLVFSQPTGIYLMNLKKWEQEKKVELTLFNDQNGFGGLEPGQNGAMKDSKGNIWMTTGTEVVKMNPGALDFKRWKVCLQISGCNGKPLPFNQESLALPRNDRSAVVQFQAICFNQPKAPLYSWRIAGSGNEWSAWQKENYAVLTMLSDGKSVFEVRTKIPGLPNSEASAQLSVYATIALWRQDWFFPALIVLFLVLVILSMVLFFQTRTRLLEASKQAKTFQVQAILSQLNPHFIFNVMASIQSEILSANIQKANDYLVKMSALIRGFLEASVSAGFSRSKNIKQSEMKLIHELEILEHFIQFQQFIYPDRFDYDLVLGADVHPAKVSIPPMLIQPFVENSIKHGLLQKTGKGRLRISIYYSDIKTLVVEIADNGIGMEKAEAMTNKSNLLYTSRGKELTLKRIKLLNELGYIIHYRIDSSDLGTKVTLKIEGNEQYY